jgi:hypothetical protein
VRQTARHNYEEFMLIYQHCGIDDVRFDGSLSVQQYLELYSPAVKWMLQAQFIGLEDMFSAKDSIVRQCFNEVDNVQHPGLIIHHLLDCAPPNLISTELDRLAHVTCSNKDSEYSFPQVLLAFGRAVIRATEAIRVKNKVQTLRNVMNQCWTANVERVAKLSLELFLK